MRHRVESFTIHPNSRTIVHGLPIALVDDPTPGLAWIVIEDIAGATVLAALGSAGYMDEGAVYLGTIAQGSPGSPLPPIVVFRLGT